jgi:putative Mg2+ transporter-C (MgtC) family protein
MNELQIFFQAMLAAFLGGLIGLEREYKGKAAGLRTYSLVCLGSAFFTLIAFEFCSSFSGNQGVSLDLIRIIQAIAIGIGFIGGGLIVFRESHVEGLTTAAGLWMVAAIGVAIGARFYFPAVFVAFLTIGILAGVRLAEEKWFNKRT